MAELRDRPLAELHELAAKAGIERYRLLRRDQLVEELGGRERPDEAASEAGESAEPEAAKSERPRRRRRRAPDSRRSEVKQDEGEGDEEEQPEAEREDAPTETVTGILDLMPQRFGFLRLQGLEAEDGDVYISASQIRRCELRAGDEVTGPAREPRRGERHRALVHVETVNGAEAGAERREFDTLTAVAPHRRLALEGTEGDAGILLRALDLLTPLALGQRVLVSAPPRSGRTTLLRALATELAGREGTELIVLLVDERPEEATRWRQAVPDATLAIATAEMKPADQGRLGDLAVAHARRRVEAGADVILLVDSLSRLVASRRDAGDVKRLFGSGRETDEEGTGSLTVIATVLDGGSDPAHDAVATTENALVALDPALAAAGVYPAIDIARSGVSGEEDLRSPEELEAARRLRAELAEMPARDAAGALRERIDGSASNADLLTS